MTDIIKCPRCGHAGGNMTDPDRKITIWCQHCKYPDLTPAMKFNKALQGVE